VCTSLAIVALIAVLTPPLYTTWRPTWLPWWLESYIDGCHNFGAPQPWLFPLFPWAAFAFAGLAAGFILFSEQARSQVAKTLAVFALVGATAILAARELDHSPFHLYSTYDYWHTSPNFLMMRIGLLLVIAFISYAWCRWGLATRGFSPLIQLGQTSLLVYWVHIEFVYGRFSLLPKRSESIPAATRGLLEITLFMLILSLLRTKIDWKRIDWKKMSRRIQPAW
jgi:fucose 4-O-acetylase-like acetyltransferase